MSRIRKLALLLSISAFPLGTAWAGWYGGVQLGLADINQTAFTSGQVQPDTNTLFNPRTNFTVSGTNFSSLSVANQTINTFSATQENNAYMLNVFYGYSFTRFAALEMGFIAAAPFKNQYQSTTNTTLTGIATNGGISVPFTQAFPMTVKRSDRGELFILDLAYKASLPLHAYFEVFTKMGYALYWQRTDSKISGTIRGVASFSSETKSTKRRTAPLIALGASYFYNEYSSFDFTWTRLIPHITDKDEDENVDLFGLGFTLRFCTNYC